MKTLWILTMVILAAPAQAGEILPGDDDPLGGMIKGGLALGGLAFTSSFFLSAELQDKNVYTDDISDPFYIGSAFGAAGLATGVHLGNQKRGSWLWTTLASGLVGAAGAKLTVESDNPEVWVAVVPAIQLVSAVAVQNMTTPGRAEKQTRQESRPMIGVAPTTDGGCLLIRGTF